MRFFTNLRRFLADAKGNIAVLFGLSIVPVIGVMGVAVDYSLATASRTALQAALDNTALILAKEMPLTDAQLQSRGWQIFQGNIGYSPLIYGQSDFVITQGTSDVTITITGTYNTKLASVLRLVGMNTSFPVAARTVATWGNTRLRIALVLDNTGSMADSGKIGALQTASKNFIDQLKAVANANGDILVSIIPFSKDVNVGATNYNASWVDFTLGTDSWDANNGTCSVSGFTTKSTCEQSHSVSSCSNPIYTQKKKCENNGGTWTTTSVTGVWTHANHNTWNGCIMDRPKTTADASAPGTASGYDQLVDVPSASVPNYPAEQYGLCPIEMIGLTDVRTDSTTLKNKIDAMTPNGNTNQPVGLVWGWQSLVGGGPLTAVAMDPNHTYNQYVIILSDGLNTQDRWYGTQSSIDNRMYYNPAGTASGTCINIKNAGIKVYTVQVNTGGDPTSTLLQNCASDPSMFFQLTSSSQIVSTFQQIGQALSNLHLSM